MLHIGNTWVQMLIFGLKLKTYEYNQKIKLLNVIVHKTNWFYFQLVTQKNLCCILKKSGSSSLNIIILESNGKFSEKGLT